MDEKQKKKILIKAVIGIVLFLMLIIGAAFAYFNIDVANNVTNKNNRVHLQNQYVVTKTGGADISLALTNDMVALGLPDTTYYASSTGPVATETSEVFATLQTAETETLACDYTIEITKSSAGTDLFDVVKNNGIENELVLELTSTSGLNISYDMKNTAWENNKIIVNDQLTGLTENVDVNFSVKLSLKIYAELAQNYLAGANSSVSVEMTSLTCRRA